MLPSRLVSKGRVLIVSDDEWMSAVLAKYLRDDGYEVDSETAARSAYAKLKSEAPDCIICDETLPDIDGFWVVNRVRAEQSNIATTPFILVSDTERTAAKLQGVDLGVDAYLHKPLRGEEVVAQIRALLDMAARLRANAPPSSQKPGSSDGGAALRGDLSQMSLPTVLTVLEMERRSGTLRIESPSRPRVGIVLAEGMLVSAQVAAQTVQPVRALRAVLRYKEGRFAFSPALVQPDSGGPRHHVGALLLEAMRQEDEEAR